eukprot:SAG11_NODE_2714_length_3052_cov_1.918727_2_plen_208_part_00
MAAAAAAAAAGAGTGHEDKAAVEAKTEVKRKLQAAKWTAPDAEMHWGVRLGVDRSCANWEEVIALFGLETEQLQLCQHRAGAVAPDIADSAEGREGGGTQRAGGVAAEISFGADELSEAERQLVVETEEQSQLAALSRKSVEVAPRRPSCAETLAQLKRLRHTLVVETEEARAVDAKCMVLRQEVATVEVQNQKLRYQIAHMTRSIA